MVFIVNPFVLIFHETSDTATQAKHQMERRAKSVSDDTECDHASTQLDQILNKLEQNKKTADQQYQMLLMAINKINSRLDALEIEQSEFVRNLDYYNKEVADLKAGYEELLTTINELKCSIDARQGGEQAVRNNLIKM